MGGRVGRPWEVGAKGGLVDPWVEGWGREGGNRQTVGDK